jgi:hypothetical protein
MLNIYKEVLRVDNPLNICYLAVVFITSLFVEIPVFILKAGCNNFCTW